MIQNIRVLIVDDDIEAARTLGLDLARGGYACELARSDGPVLAHADGAAWDVVVCEAYAATQGALHLVERLRRTCPQLPIIVLTAHGSIPGAVDAIKHGAAHYLTKPGSLAMLDEPIRRAIPNGRASTRPPSALHPHAASRVEIVHESTTMKELLALVARVALSAAPVLIVGESGTGKELVARAIHAGGPRAKRPFVAVNLTAIPEHLLESELFGHVRGAFTGALHPRAGLFMEADGGTLLLDEIGDMPKSLQPKILRALQFGEVRSVGSDRMRHVDVRIIAATHRDLSAMITDGQFRADLRYRLDTLPLRVPPLRERREDIAPLVRQFLSDARARAPASPVEHVGEAAMALLERASWPGNVRELESVIERLVVFGCEVTVVPRDLAFLDESIARTQGSSWPDADGRPLTLRQMSERYLDWMLEQTEGDKTRAAKLLGMDLSTLYRWRRPKN